jgi:uncharacterized protein YcbX
MTQTGIIDAICRYPVKSMHGEDIYDTAIGKGGIPGDRAYAVVDRSDGKIASAKNPRKWAALLAFRAAFVDEPTDGRLPPVTIVGPDGADWRSDEPGSDVRLSRALGREVALTTTRSADASYEAIWPEIAGLVPAAFLESVTTGVDHDGTHSDLGVAMAAPDGGFVDVAPLHLLTTGTLDHLRQLSPGASLQWRRFRPNLLVRTPGAELIEAGSTGMTVVVGTVEAVVQMPTMRCVMTTLAHAGLAADRSGLRAIAAHNRVEIPGLGTWACAGLYAGVTIAGVVRIGDTVTFRSSEVRTVAEGTV